MWAAMAAVTRGLLSSCTLPWWRRTFRVWLTSRSLLINEYWNNTLISQSSFPEFGSLRGSRAAKPANDSPLTTNSFCNWNIGIPLIRTAIHQWCLLIKGFTLRSMGRKQQNWAPQVSAHSATPSLQKEGCSVDGCQHSYRLEQLLVNDEILGHHHVCEMTSLDQQHRAECQNARLSGGKAQEIIDWISTWAQCLGMQGLLLN